MTAALDYLRRTPSAALLLVQLGGLVLYPWFESVGLSDVLPVTPMARGLVMLEAFAGVMYIALVVSRVVSLTGRAGRT